MSPGARAFTRNDLETLPVASLAARLLRQLVGTQWPGPVHRRDAHIRRVVHGVAHEGRPGLTDTAQTAEQHAPLTFALSEAWSWLVSHDLLAPSPLPDPQYPNDPAFAPTRLGYELAGLERPLD